MKIKIFRFRKVKSTNNTAIRIVKKTDLDYGMIISEMQDNGRGQYGKKWVSYRGNLFVSFFYSLEKINITLRQLTKTNCLLVKKLLSFYYKKKIIFKKPNDLIINRKKICGILQETLIKFDKKYLVVGIGINLVKNPNIKNYPTINLSELVNKNGSKIGGDYKIDQINSMTTSPSEPPVTTDDYMKATKQGKSLYMFRSFYTEDDETNTDVKEPKEDTKKKKGKKKSKKKKIKESKSVLEGIFTKKDFDKEFVEKKDSSIKLDKIPNLEFIRETNPILIRKVSALKDIIEKNISSGEEIAVVINYLLDLDLSDVPSEYKNILKNKIK